MVLAPACRKSWWAKRSPAGVAFYERRPAHCITQVKMLDGTHRLVEATAYPLFGAGETLHGVVTVFWQIAQADG